MKKQFIIWMTSMFVCHTFKASAQWQALPMVPMSMFPTNSLGHNYYVAHFLGGDTVISFVNYGSDQGGRRKALYSFNANQTAFEYYDVPSFRTETRGMYKTSDNHVIVSLDLKINRTNITQWDTLTDGFFRSSNQFLTIKYHANYFGKPNMPLYYYDSHFSYEPLYKRSSFFDEGGIIIDTFTFNWISGSISQSLFALDTIYLWARFPFPMTASTPSTAARTIGRFHKSIDGGQSWIPIPTNLDTMYNLERFEMQSFYFISKDTGYMAATRRPGNGDLANRQSIVFKTTDGGSTWIKIFEKTTGVDIMFRDLFFINQYVGFGYHSQTGSRVYKTEDGGISWHEQISLSNLGGVEIREMKYENGILSVRNLMNVYYTKTLGDPVPATGIEQVNMRLKGMNIYPNPTNEGRASISWLALSDEDVELAIYDLLGKQVFQKSYTHQQKGYSSITFDTYLSQGTYLVKMKQGDKFDTKTIVVTGR